MIMFYALAIFNVFMAAVAQMLLKKAAMQKHGNVAKEYLNPWVIGGYIIMGLVMLSNVFAMSKGVQLKELGTIEALSYLFVPALAYFTFKEKFTAKKATSIAIILVGVVIFFW